MWLHSLHLDRLLDATGYNLRDLDCPFAEPLTPPVFVHAMNAAMFDWPGPKAVGEFQAFLYITYSFEPKGERFVAGRSAKGEVIVPGSAGREPDP